MNRLFSALLKLASPVRKWPSLVKSLLRACLIRPNYLHTHTRQQKTKRVHLLPANQCQKTEDLRNHRVIMRGRGLYLSPTPHTERTVRVGSGRNLLVIADYCHVVLACYVAFYVSRYYATVIGSVTACGVKIWTKQMQMGPLQPDKLGYLRHFRSITWKIYETKPSKTKIRSEK